MDEPLRKNRPTPNEIIAVSEMSLIDTNMETTIEIAINTDPYAVTSEICTGFQPILRATGERAVKSIWMEAKAENIVKTGNDISK
mmetsp:Transcript_1917/g.4490  ORF Transcript_1917/g.4490 Transcript_1917/m.4490 type:complete len:85 (+) Transcript_1917:2138-2392(+)